MLNKRFNMNALPFVNSESIRSHLEKIGYEFSPSETAWLIYHSRNHTLAEKHAAWRRLAVEYPDAPFDAKYADAPFGRLLDYILLYVSTEEKLLERFMTNDGSFVYCAASLDENPDIEYCMDEVFARAYSDYLTCIEALKKEHKRVSGQYEEVTDGTKYKIYCRPLDGGILSLAGSEGWSRAEEFSPYHAFDFMWFSFPVPFHKGDILLDPERESGFCCGPVVMCDITPEHFTRTKRRGGDSSDMNVWGYFQNDDGTIYKEVTSNYMDFEYCPAEMLTGKRRILTALSDLVREKIDIELFSAAYLHILAEEAAREAVSDAFADEAVRLAGRE